MTIYVDFFVGNGVERIVDENDYIDPSFTASWEISDEDLMRRAHEESEAVEDKPFNSLVFLVVADHHSRVYGDSLIPIDRFYIPGPILGDDIQLSSYARIASQIDLAPTLLSLIGIDTTNPLPGRDLTNLGDDMPSRAMMQFNVLNAYMEEDKVAILRRILALATFACNEGELISTDDKAWQLRIRTTSL